MNGWRPGFIWIEEEQDEHIFICGYMEKGPANHEPNDDSWMGPHVAHVSVVPLSEREPVIWCVILVIASSDRAGDERVSRNYFPLIFTYKLQHSSSSSASYLLRAGSTEQSVGHYTILALKNEWRLPFAVNQFALMCLQLPLALYALNYFCSFVFEFTSCTWERVTNDKFYHCPTC